MHNIGYNNIDYPGFYYDLEEILFAIRRLRRIEGDNFLNMFFRRFGDLNLFMEDVLLKR